MTDVVFASSRADLEAAEAVEQHHVKMTAALATNVEALVSAAADGRPVDETREDLIGWCRRELVPHALAEEGSLYAAAQELPESRLLVEAMTAEHAVIPSLLDRLGDGLDAVRTVASAALAAGGAGEPRGHRPMLPHFRVI